VLRREFAIGRPAEVPDAPTHASLLAEQEAQSVVRLAETATAQNS
jgi:hypothetical protein